MMTPLMPAKFAVPFSYETLIAVFRQIAKDIAAVIGFFSAFLGIPLGAYELIAHRYFEGALILIGSVTVFLLALWVCRYFHKQEVHASAFGYIPGILGTPIGAYLLYSHGLIDPAIFLKLYLIALVGFLHSSTDKKIKTTAWMQYAFWAQKAMIITGLVFVAFARTSIFLIGGIVLAFAFFWVSIALYMKYGESEEPTTPNL